MATSDKKTEDFFSTVDRETADERERTDSKVLYQALVERKDALGAQGSLPAEDKQLSENILNQARQRSAQISGAARRGPSGTTAAPARGIPWWLIVAWILAIAAAFAAFKLL